MRGKGVSGSFPEWDAASQGDGDRTGTAPPNPPSTVLKGPPPRAAASEVAGYIEVLVAEMRQMAQTAHLESLAYFLEMARVEAALQARRLGCCEPERAG
jgi:hypothetical protein